MSAVEKRIGFLSFGHWQPIPGRRCAPAGRAGAERRAGGGGRGAGLDGAYVRVHHFARQLASPFPLLTAIAARTSRIEIGTGVIDMRYENPLYMAEEAAATDLLSDGRLQLGVSADHRRRRCAARRRSATCRPRASTTPTSPGDKTALFLAALRGAVLDADPRMTGGGRPAGRSSRSRRAGRRIWWGSGTRATARVDGASRG